MTIAVGARSAIGAIVETTWGTTPATPNLVTLPFTQFSLNKTIAKFTNNQIQGDRMLRPSTSGNHAVAGDLDVNYQPLNYDTLLESLFNSSFATNVLKLGNTRKSFTIEHSQVDVGEYTQYTGVIVDKLALKIGTNGLVTAKFSLLGKESPAITTTSVDADGYTAASEANAFVHNGGTFKEGGTAFGAFMSMDITFENKSSSNFALGADAVRDFSSNFFEVTGTATVYFEDATFYNKFINSTSSSLEFTLTNGTNTHDFLIPNVRYHGANKTIAGNGPVTMTVPFVGFYDVTTGTNAQITRT